jgi:putative PIN family toxin of toxin-antitoxin system
VFGVTLDTNVYVSAFTYGGKPLQLLELAAKNAISLAVSEPIIEEIIRVLRDKFRWEDAALREVEVTVRNIAEVVTPTQAVDVIKSDPPDNRVLECAQAAGSDYIVSGDRDLLRLGQFAKVQIVKVAELLQAVQEQGR